MISDILKLVPSNTRIKGEVSPGGKTLNPTTSWTLSTEYEESYDVMEQMTKLIDILKTKIPELKKIKKSNDVKYIFMFAVEVEDREVPGFYLEGDILSFVSEIDSAIDLDMYIL